MIRKYHNHKLQITPWHREEEPLNHHKTPGRQIKQNKTGLQNQIKKDLLSIFQEYKKVCLSSNPSFMSKWLNEHLLI